jgi:predicted transcriptional regulator
VTIKVEREVRVLRIITGIAVADVEAIIILVNPAGEAILEELGENIEISGWHE